MPDAKEISALTTAESTSASDLFETALPNAMTETGYISRKVTLGTIANFLLSTLQFSSLNTTVKNIIGAINELAQGSGQSLDALNDVDIDDQTLTNGQGIVYDATSQKWKNGTVGGGGSHTYSTTEQVVGTWIDGSTLYEKTINFGTLPNNTTKEVQHNISNVEHIWIAEGWAENPTTHFTNMLSLANTDIAGQWYFGVNQTIVQSWTGKNRTAYTNCYVVLRYTKSST
jgi:hypothetical protein